MTPAETSRLIDKAGGNTAFAELLGLDSKPGFMQRITNWRSRGLPPAVILEHQEKLEQLRQSKPKKVA